ANDDKNGKNGDDDKDYSKDDNNNNDDGKDKSSYDYGSGSSSKDSSDYEKYKGEHKDSYEFEKRNTMERHDGDKWCDTDGNGDGDSDNGDHYYYNGDKHDDS